MIKNEKQYRLSLKTIENLFKEIEEYEDKHYPLLSAHYKNIERDENFLKFNDNQVDNIISAFNNYSHGGHKTRPAGPPKNP